jgi:predicted dienelactone hydrolase
LIPQGAYNWRGASTRALVTTVWYPAIAGTAMTEHVIGPADTPLFRLGQWAVDARPVPKPFPLIVLSHGTGGSAQIMAWLARGLASWGYVVAGVNHPGNNALEEYTPEGFLLWWERARDLTTAIDMLVQDPMLGPLIDPKRVGAAGFSLGGYTMFEVVGGRTDPALFQKFCRSKLAEGCAAPPEFPDLLTRWTQLESTSKEFRNAVQQAGRSLRDPRIRGAFAIAPALGPAFIPESLRDIAVPVAIVAGMNDRIAPVGPNARSLAQLTPRATLSLLPGVGHYTFLASCTAVGARAQPQLCADAPGVDRAVVHQRTIDAARQFFEQALK